ncbi:hypothetical protein IWW36_001386 [Coemansia brasiliensis]|uniref:Tyrosinase copper-binding domain-containing protein n=1 Tax=Coemansia brasiliensis TaxID=2650707 RepID=A0A9W8M233_9FUNG|nr:hypothetical protein IWW36_001386 [Coemansia brasiliensis]
MRFLISAVVAAAAISSVVAQGPQPPPRCGSMRTRRSAHSLSNEDWQRIGRVLAQMHDDGHIDRFARAHQALFEFVHGSTTFFPFHRKFVQEFEDIGRQIDPDFTVPYWDSTRDYRDPASSPILRNNTLGGNGRGPNSCLPDGIQGQWNMQFPGDHCLRRQFDNGDSIRPWIPAEVISSFIQSDDWISVFREDIEYGIHGAVHLGLGGDASTRFAPNDFFFFMHHANIDRLWWLWQNSHFMLDYNGPGPNGEASLDDVIPQNDDVDFGGARVGSVMVLGYEDNCYTYDSAPGAPSSYPGFESDGPDRIIHGSQIPMPAFSGSSDVSGFGLEIMRMRRALSGDSALKQFYPGVAALESSRNMGADMANVDECSCQERMAKRLLYPAPMTDSWIKMHKFDPHRIAQAYQKTCRLIDRLNNSTYVSPY